MRAHDIIRSEITFKLKFRHVFNFFFTCEHIRRCVPSLTHFAIEKTLENSRRKKFPKSEKQLRTFRMIAKRPIVGEMKSLRRRLISLKFRLLEIYQKNTRKNARLP